MMPATPQDAKFVQYALNVERIESAKNAENLEFRDGEVHEVSTGRKFLGAVRRLPSASATLDERDEQRRIELLRENLVFLKDPKKTPAAHLPARKFVEILPRLSTILRVADTAMRKEIETRLKAWFERDFPDTPDHIRDLVLKFYATGIKPEDLKKFAEGAHKDYACQDLYELKMIAEALNLETEIASALKEIEDLDKTLQDVDLELVVRLDKLKELTRLLPIDSLKHLQKIAEVFKDNDNFFKGETCNLLHQSFLRECQNRAIPARVFIAEGKAQPTAVQFELARRCGQALFGDIDPKKPPPKAFLDHPLPFALVNTEASKNFQARLTHFLMLGSELSFVPPGTPLAVGKIAPQKNYANDFDNNILPHLEKQREAIKNTAQLLTEQKDLSKIPPENLPAIMTALSVALAVGPHIYPFFAEFAKQGEKNEKYRDEQVDSHFALQAALHPQIGIKPPISYEQYYDLIAFERIVKKVQASYDELSALSTLYRALQSKKFDPMLAQLTPLHDAFKQKFPEPVGARGNALTPTPQQLAYAHQLTRDYFAKIPGLDGEAARPLMVRAIQFVLIGHTEYLSSLAWPSKGFMLDSDPNFGIDKLIQLQDDFKNLNVDPKYTAKALEMVEKGPDEAWIRSASPQEIENLLRAFIYAQRFNDKLQDMQEHLIEDQKFAPYVGRVGDKLFLKPLYLPIGNNPPEGMNDDEYRTLLYYVRERNKLQDLITNEESVVKLAKMNVQSTAFQKAFDPLLAKYLQRELAEFKTQFPQTIGIKNGVPQFNEKQLQAALEIVQKKFAPFLSPTHPSLNGIPTFVLAAILTRSVQFLAAGSLQRLNEIPWAGEEPALTDTELAKRGEGKFIQPQKPFIDWYIEDEGIEKYPTYRETLLAQMPQFFKDVHRGISVDYFIAGKRYDTTATGGQFESFLGALFEDFQKWLKQPDNRVQAQLRLQELENRLGRLTPTNVAELLLGPKNSPVDPKDPAYLQLVAALNKVPSSDENLLYRLCAMHILQLACVAHQGVQFHAFMGKAAELQLTRTRIDPHGGIFIIGDGGFELRMVDDFGRTTMHDQPVQPSFRPKELRIDFGYTCNNIFNNTRYNARFVDYTNVRIAGFANLREIKKFLGNSQPPPEIPPEPAPDPAAGVGL